MSARDQVMFAWVRKFNPYDLCFKGASRPGLKGLRLYHEGLIAEFFPEPIDW